MSGGGVVWAPLGAGGVTPQAAQRTMALHQGVMGLALLARFEAALRPSTRLESENLVEADGGGGSEKQLQARPGFEPGEALGVGFERTQADQSQVVKRGLVTDSLKQAEPESLFFCSSFRPWKGAST